MHKIYIHLTPRNLLFLCGAGRGKEGLEGVISWYYVIKYSLIAIVHNTHFFLFSPRARLLKVKSQELSLSLYCPQGSKHRMPSLPESGPRGLRKYGRKPSIFQNVNFNEFPSFSFCTILAHITITFGWDHGNILLTLGLLTCAVLTSWAGLSFVVGAVLHNVGC